MVTYILASTDNTVISYNWLSTVENCIAWTFLTFNQFSLKRISSKPYELVELHN